MNKRQHLRAQLTPQKIQELRKARAERLGTAPGIPSYVSELDYELARLEKEENLP